jgi:hypothetical protein
MTGWQFNVRSFGSTSRTKGALIPRRERRGPSRYPLASKSSRVPINHHRSLGGSDSPLIAGVDGGRSADLGVTCSARRLGLPNLWRGLRQPRHIQAAFYDRRVSTDLSR